MCSVQNNKITTTKRKTNTNNTYKDYNEIIIINNKLKPMIK